MQIAFAKSRLEWQCKNREARRVSGDDVGARRQSVILERVHNQLGGVFFLCVRAKAATNRKGCQRNVTRLDGSAGSEKNKLLRRISQVSAHIDSLA